MFLKILKFIKQYALPFAMIIGGIFHNFFIKLAPITPFLIFFMLFFPYCKIQVKDLKFQDFIISVGYQISEALPRTSSCTFSVTGGPRYLICMMAPTATAALLSWYVRANMAVMAVIHCFAIWRAWWHIMFSFIGIQTENFFGILLVDLKKVIPCWFSLFWQPMLKIIAPKPWRHKKVKRISFYLWIVP